jgi:histidyl-tRNA synthetase
VGFKTDFSYKGGSLGKQLKQASALNAAKCVIVGQEYKSGQLVVKNMADGSQQNITEKDFFDRLR